MTSPGHNRESLDVLIQRITNPLSPSYDPALVYAFCERVRLQQDGPAAATRLLAYRIQSPQEQEAMLALDLLDTCARTAGPGFQAELGKFRFLNELIKLLSPRYLGPRSSQRVKQRVADLLLTWSKLMPHETKVQEAFALLEKQGLLTLHGITPRVIGGASPRQTAELTAYKDADRDPPLDPHRPPTPPLPSTDRPANPIFEDSQKAALLKRLLQSTNPEDIQAANRLIKTMVKQDEERVERVSRRVTELETVHTNLRLLKEMMDSYSPGSTSRDELELMAELAASCQQLRSKLDSLAAETDDQDPALGELVSASEEIGETLSRHAVLQSGGGSGGATLTLLQLEPSPSPAAAPSSAAAEAGRGAETASSQLLLDMQLQQLGLADPAPAPVASSATVAPSIPAALLGRPLPPPGPPSPAAAGSSPGPGGASLGLGGVSRGQGAALADLLGSLSPPQTPAPAQLTRSPQRAAAAPVSPARSAFDDLDDLVRQSMAGKPLTNSRSQPSQTRSGSSGSAPTKLSANQSAAPAGSLPAQPIGAADRPTNGCPAEAGLDAGQPIGDLLGDDVSLLSSLSGPSSHDSLLSEGRLDLGQLKPDPERSDGGRQGAGRVAGDTASGAARPASLADVSVTLDQIKPGGGAPMPLFSEPDSLEISLHRAGNRPRDDVTVYVITALNRTGRPVSQYTLQAVCDKVARVRLLAPSSSELPAGSPFLPPPAVSQLLLLANPHQAAVCLRFMLSYSVDGDVITEMSDVTLPADQL